MSSAAESLVRIFDYDSLAKPFLRKLLIRCFEIYCHLPAIRQLHGRDNAILQCFGDLTERVVTPQNLHLVSFSLFVHILIEFLVLCYTLLGPMS